MTQAKLSDLVECGPEQISEWESGKGGMKVYRLAQIAKALRRDMCYFVPKDYLP